MINERDLHYRATAIISHHGIIGGSRGAKFQQFSLSSSLRVPRRSRRRQLDEGVAVGGGDVYQPPVADMRAYDRRARQFASYSRDGLPFNPAAPCVCVCCTLPRFSMRDLVLQLKRENPLTGTRVPDITSTPRDTTASVPGDKGECMPGIGWNSARRSRQASNFPPLFLTLSSLSLSLLSSAIDWPGLPESRTGLNATGRIGFIRSTFQFAFGAASIFQHC